MYVRRSCFSQGRKKDRGAAISLTIGSLLFLSGGTYQEVHSSLPLIYLLGGLIVVLGFAIVAMVARTRHARVTTGSEGMIGACVIALTALRPEGRVSYGGEDWAAVLDPPTMSASVGSELRIVSVEGLRLHVQLITYTLPPADRLYIEGA